MRLLVVAMFGVLVAGCCCGSLPISEQSSTGDAGTATTKRKASKGTAAASTPASPPTPGRCLRGAPCFAWGESPDDVALLFRSEDDYDEAARAAAKKDTYRFAELLSRGRRLTRGTQVSMTKGGFEGCEYRVIEGPAAGFLGWGLCSSFKDRPAAK